MIIKYRYRVLGGHTHVRVFTGKGINGLGLSGTLIFRNEEWDEFKRWTGIASTALTMTRADVAGGVYVGVHFVEDDPEPTPEPTEPPDPR